MIFVVRHAKAGSRSEWDRPDDERPLSGPGFLQATALAERLADDGAAKVISSPYVRCVQTVEPLAALIGVPVETSDDLAEGNPGDEAMTMIADSPDGTVLCSHGDVLQDLAWLLAASGAPVDPRIPFQKGAVLRLERDGMKVVSARYEPPPA